MRGISYEVFTIGCLFIIGFLLGVLYTRTVSRLHPKLFTWLSTEQIILNQNEYGERIVADVLSNKIRVVCMILTSPNNYEVKARHVKETWAKHCNKHFFVSSVADDYLPSVAAVSHEGRDVLWNKTKFAMRYASKMFGDDYDYFLKADDDTYVIVENLRKLLLGYSSEIPFIMGRRFRPFVKQGYLSGGGGYVLSRTALRQIIHALNHDPRCLDSQTEGPEDVQLGQCAEVANVTLLDSLDEYGLERFHPFRPQYMQDELAMNATQWISDYNYHKLAYGLNCCSDYSVSFHYIRPSDMYVLDFLTYHVRPYGIHRDYSDLDLLAEVIRPSADKQKPVRMDVLEITEQHKKNIFDNLKRRSKNMHQFKTH